jgi:hypothetical protein
MGAAAMPIRFLLEEDHAFSPDDVKILVDAFEGTLRALGLTDAEDPSSIKVAKIIVGLAKDGERDPARLRDLALKFVRPWHTSCLRGPFNSTTGANEAHEAGDAAIDRVSTPGRSAGNSTTPSRQSTPRSAPPRNSVPDLRLVLPSRGRPRNARSAASA